MAGRGARTETGRADDNVKCAPGDRADIDQGAINVGERILLHDERDFIGRLCKADKLIGAAVKSGLDKI